MKDVQQTNAGKWKRIAAFTLAGVMTWHIMTPSVTQFMGAMAEDGGPLSKIYGILSDSVGEPKTAQDHYELATISVGRGEYEKALEQLSVAREMLTAPAEGEESKILTAEETALLAEMQLKAASVYILTGKMEDAKAALNESLALNGESAQALLLRSQIAIEAGEYQPAIADLKQYLELKPTDSANRLTLAQLMEAMSDYMGALEQYELLSAQHPADESHQLNALRCRFLAGQYEEAIKGFDAYKARHAQDEKDPFGGIADFLRAACLMQQGDYAAASEGFEMAIAAGYDRASCLEQLTLCHFETAEYDKVLAAGEELMGMEGAVIAAPELVLQRMGLALMRQSDYEGALAQLDKVQEINAKLEGNEYYRGVCLLSLQRQQEAVDAFTASIENDYLVQFCYYNRGVCYVDLLEYEKAIEDMSMTLSTGDDPDLIAAAKDILWQLASYFEQMNATETEGNTDQ